MFSIGETGGPNGVGGEGRSLSGIVDEGYVQGFEKIQRQLEAVDGVEVDESYPCLNNPTLYRLVSLDDTDSNLALVPTDHGSPVARSAQHIAFYWISPEAGSAENEIVPIQGGLPQAPVPHDEYVERT